MLVYLHKDTWTSGEASAAFAKEVTRALCFNVQLLLAHEMLGVEQEPRGGVEFAAFFDCDQGTTPPQLLKAGIYSQIAVALKGCEHRKVSMALLAKALIDPPEDVDPAAVSSLLQRDASNAPAAGASTAMVLHDTDGDGVTKDARNLKPASRLQRWRRLLRPASPILSCSNDRSDEPKPRKASVGQTTAV